jgi:recombination protein RecT
MTNVDTTGLRSKVASSVPAKASNPANTISDYLKRMAPEIARALPKHMDADRLSRVVMTTIRTNPKLLECNVPSLIAAVMQSAQLGLEPGLLGHCYLIPFKDSKNNTSNVQFIVGYKGLIDLARRSGNIESIAAHVVHENDEFLIEYGLEEKLVHKPATKDRGKPILVYAYAKFTGGGHQTEFMTLDEVEAIRRRSKSANNGPWVTDWAEMAKKTVIRRLWKYLPISIEIASQAAQDGTVKTQISEDMTDVPDESGEILDAIWSTEETDGAAPITESTTA